MSSWKPNGCNDVYNASYCTCNGSCEKVYGQSRKRELDDSEVDSQIFERHH